MSCQHKNLMEKRSTSSESSESRSDKQVEKSEENLEHLQIEKGFKHETIEELMESKQLDSPDQGGTLTKNYDLCGEQIPGLNGHQSPCLKSSDSCLDKDINKSEDCAQPQDDWTLDYKMTVPGAVTEMVDSVNVTPLEQCPNTISMVESGNLQFLTEMQIFDTSLYSGHIERSSSLTTMEDKSTSLEVPDILTKLADGSIEGSLYQDASENLERDQSPSYASALDAQGFDSSDMNTSGLQEDSFPLSSLIMSTLTGVQRDCVSCPHNPETDERDISIERLQQPSGLIDESNPQGQRLKHMERLLQTGEKNEETPKSSSCAEDSKENIADRILQIDKIDEIVDRQMIAPHDQRKNFALLSSNKNSAEKEPIGRILRSRSKPELARRAKMANKSNIDSGYSMKFNETKRSSRKESHRKVPSPKIKRSNNAQDESSRSESARKKRQKSGHVRNMQHSTILSKESIINKEEEPVDTSKHEKPEMMEVNEASAENMETSPRKPEDVAASPKLMESKFFVQETSSSTNVVDCESSSMETELSSDVEPKQTMDKSKRNEAKLRTLPPSNERPITNPPKADIIQSMKK